jgi:hypothetical protein
MAAAKTASQQTPQKDAAKRAPGDRRSPIGRTTDLSEQVLEQLQEGQRGAIAAVRKFVGSADDAVPSLSDGPSRPQEVIDSALEMSERLVQVQYEFVRSVVKSAGDALTGRANPKR